MTIGDVAEIIARLISRSLRGPVTLTTTETQALSDAGVLLLRVCGPSSKVQELLTRPLRLAAEDDTNSLEQWIERQRGSDV